MDVCREVVPPEVRFADGVRVACHLFPTADTAADTRRMTDYIEQRVLEMPEQYFWMHKRFKTRPPGEPSPYRKPKK